MTHRIVDKDFEYGKRDLWYRAEVSYLENHTPETADSPAENNIESDINVFEVTEYLGNHKERVLNFQKLPEEMRDAIEADALLSAREEG